MGIFSATGFSSFQRVSIGGFAFLLSSVLLLQFGLVSCVPEDYYNPDYDEAGAGAGFEMYGNWGDFNPAAAADETDTSVETMKRHLGALASSKSSRFTGLTGLRSHRSDLGFEFGGDNANFGRFVRTSSWNSPFARFAEYKAQSNLDAPLMKHKRFLGTLARGGWFPRQFRGSVDSQAQWEKRHVGAAAKLGWLRPSNSNKRDLFGGDFQGGRFEQDS